MSEAQRWVTEEEISVVREKSFANMCAKPSDINEHLPTLRRLASECSHVTEMGVRTGLSTLAFLAAQPKELVSWDIDPMSILSANMVNLMAMSGATQFQPRVGDSRKVVIEPTDLLFIDTLHTCEQLKAELFQHVMREYFTGPHRVRKYLVLHDTSTFGFVGEDDKTPGLRGALRWFQEACMPTWALMEDHVNNNGLTVLRHSS